MIKQKNRARIATYTISSIIFSIIFIWAIIESIIVSLNILDYKEWLAEKSSTIIEIDSIITGATFTFVVISFVLFSNSKEEKFITDIYWKTEVLVLIKKQAQKYSRKNYLFAFCNPGLIVILSILCTLFELLGLFFGSITSMILCEVMTIALAFATLLRFLHFRTHTSSQMRFTVRNDKDLSKTYSSNEKSWSDDIKEIGSLTRFDEEEPKKRSDAKNIKPNNVEKQGRKIKSSKSDKNKTKTEVNVNQFIPKTTEDYKEEKNE